MTIYTRIEPTAPVEGGTGTKQSIARGFGGASATYDGASRLQKIMGDSMLAELADSTVPESVLDLGCGTGWFSRKLAEQYPNSVVTGADLSPGMLAEAANRGPGSIHWLHADAEQLPLADNSVDLVFSNLMIQWSARPELILRECRRILRPGGRLAISTLLDGTLSELKQAWAEADPALHGSTDLLQVTPDFIAPQELDPTVNLTPQLEEFGGRILSLTWTGWGPAFGRDLKMFDNDRATAFLGDGDWGGDYGVIRQKSMIFDLGGVFLLDIVLRQNE